MLTPHPTFLLSILSFHLLFLCAELELVNLSACLLNGIHRIVLVSHRYRAPVKTTRQSKATDVCILTARKTDISILFSHRKLDGHLQYGRVDELITITEMARLPPIAFPTYVFSRSVSPNDRKPPHASRKSVTVCETNNAVIHPKLQKSQQPRKYHSNPSLCNHSLATATLESSRARRSRAAARARARSSTSANRCHLCCCHWPRNRRS